MLAALEQREETSGSVVHITTSCDHVNGWDQVSEVQFQLSNEQGVIFRGSYVAADNTFVMLDPANPNGPPIGSGTPGTAATFENAYVKMHLAEMSVASHSVESAALDMHWVLEFGQKTLYQNYNQSLNIIYRTGPSTTAETGFFRVGSVSVGSQIFLPLVER